MRETFPQRRPDEILQHTGTVSLDRALALREVLGRFDLPFRVVSNEGANYPDGNSQVPKGAQFVTYDTGDIPNEVIERMVNEIAPIPMIDGQR